MLARGRIRLIREYVEGNLGLTGRLKLYNDLCLGCKACLEVCPARIQVAELISLMKEEIVKKDGISLTDTALLKGLLNSPQSFRWIMNMMHLYRKMGLVSLLPPVLKDKTKLLPEIPGKSFWDRYRQGEHSPKGRKLKVGYFVGCLTNALFPDLAFDVIKVLEQHDCDVIVPKGTACCGLPHKSYGDVEGSHKMAAKNIELFMHAQVDYIVTDCGTCGHALKEYGEYPFADSSFRETAKKFSARVYDINEFLVDVVGLRVGKRAVREQVTYHDSCHLKRSQNVVSQPRKILQSIPGLEFSEMPEADWCCGAAGSFSMKHQDVSRKIIARKVKNISATGAAYVSAGCPACLMQLDYGKREFAGDYRVIHPVQLLARTYEEE